LFSKERSMQQRVRRFAFVLGVGSLVAAGLISAACGTDNGTTPTPTVEAGNKDTGPGKTDTGPDPETDAGTDAMEAADCAEAPRLRNNQTSFFCAFYRRDAAADDSGVPLSNCANDETCCNPGAISAGNFPPSFCADGKGEVACQTGALTNGSSWPDGGTAWECNDKNQCNSGQICCLIPRPGEPDTDIGAFPKNDPNVPPACNAKRAYKTGGSRCRTGNSCNAGENRLCSLSDNNCPSGSTCTPVEGLFRDLGYCFP